MKVALLVLVIISRRILNTWADWQLLVAVVVVDSIQGRITGLLLNFAYIVVRLQRSALSANSLLLLLEAASAFVTSTCICLRLIGGHPWLLMVLWRYNNPRRW